MKRRSFLLRTGLLTAGAASVLATSKSHRAPGSEAFGRPLEDDSTETVVITSAHSELAQTIAGALRRAYQVRLTAPTQLQTNYEFVKSFLNHDESTTLAVRGADAIVHVCQPLPDVCNAEEIDYRTRCTYNLLQAAVEENVRRIVYLSSLRMMNGHEENFQIDEDWRPVPTPAFGGLSDYLGEFACREFAREGKLDVIVLRLGEVVAAEELDEKASNSAWVDPRDVAQAVSRALTGLLAGQVALAGHWSLCHVRSHSPDSRFPIDEAQRVLGYCPNFGGHES